MVSPTVQKTTCLARQSLEDIIMRMIYSIFSSKKSFPALKKEGAKWWVTNTFASTRSTFIKADFVLSNLRRKKPVTGCGKRSCQFLSQLFSNVLHVYAFKTQKCVTSGRSTEAELTYMFGDRELIFLRSAHESREIYCKCLDHQHWLWLFKGRRGRLTPLSPPSKICPLVALALCSPSEPTQQCPMTRAVYP